MLNLPAELGWVSENLPFGPRLRFGPQGRFSLTHPRSAGRFIPYLKAILRQSSHGGRAGRAQVARKFHAVQHGDWGFLVEELERDLARLRERAGKRQERKK